MSSVDLQYKNVVDWIKHHGTDKKGRTTETYRSIFGTFRAGMVFNLTEGRIPFLSVKKVRWQDAVHEMLWFISGTDWIDYLLKQDIHIWDSWIDPETARYDDNGKLISARVPNVYGAQWRHWEDTRIVEDGINGFKPLSEYEAMNYDIICEIPNESGRFLIGRKIDQLQQVIDTLRNSPDSRRIIMTAWNVGKIDQMGLPPCFTPDSLVATPLGYFPISDITTGDEVLSGSGINRQVNKVWKTPYKGSMLSVKVKKLGELIKTTPNHPFLVKEKGWVEAAQLTVGDYVAIPKSKSFSDHKFTYFKGHNKGGKLRKTIECSLNDYFTFGYFLGNGWATKDGFRIHFSIPKTKENEILPKIMDTIRVAEKKIPSETVTTFETRSVKWLGIFRSFGKGASNKIIPQWIFESTIEAKQAFIEGFVAADGHKVTDSTTKVTTTSASIAYGLQRLFAELGHDGGVHYQDRPPTTVIEGRTVNQKGTYSFSVNVDKIKDPTKPKFDDNYLWLPITAVDTFDYEGDVFNLDVEEDHTYTVNNVVNHNCHSFIQFFTRELSTNERARVVWGEHFDPTEHLQNYTLNDEEQNHRVLDYHEAPRRALSAQLLLRSQDWGLGTPYNMAQYGVFVHMLAHVVGMVAERFEYVVGDAHIYDPQWEAMNKVLSRDPKPSSDPRVVLNPSIKNIDDFTIDDINVVGYDPHPFVKFPPAAV